ncbi:FHA domain-containing protein [bacterium]|nr:FHA domain-containing protein [bacterium]
MRQALSFLAATIFSIFFATLVNAQSGEVGKSASLVLFQAEIAGEQVFSSGVIVVANEEKCQALTSYEAIRGAARIDAFVSDHTEVPARVLCFAPDANLALLEIPVTNAKVAKIGDSELLKNGTPVEMISASPVFGGEKVNSFETKNTRLKVTSIQNRPQGPYMKLESKQPMYHQTDGAPIFASGTGELVAVCLSNKAANDSTTGRFAIPVSVANALSPKLSKSGDSAANIRVLDGDQAKVIANPQGGEEESDNSGYMMLVGAVVIVAIIAFFALRSKKPKIVPFSVLPIMPPGKNVAFVTAEGRLLPMNKDVITVGRSEDNDWSFPNDPSVSGRHARIKKATHPDTYEIEDLNSTNGTFVRKRKMGRSEIIHPGDIVRFGHKSQVKLMTKAESDLKNRQDSQTDDDKLS